MADSEVDIKPAGTYVSSVQAAMSGRQRRAGLVATALLVAAGIFTLKGFLPALMWAAIFAIGLRPLFDRFATRVPQHRRTLLPALFTLAVLLVFVIPLGMIAVPLIGDAHAVAQWFAQVKVNGIPAPAALSALPFSDRLIPLWQRELGQPGAMSALVGHTLQGSAFNTARAIGAGAVHRIVLLGFMLLALFFLLRDGEALAAELKVGSRRMFGPAGEHVARQAIRSVHGTINGLVIVGLAEGVILGCAYVITGVPHPALFGLLTALLAMIPFGAPLAFVIAALVLVASSNLVGAVVILALGFSVTFVADHFIRPVLIGGATRLPFIWVLLGILGGVEGWGLIGLFLGPAIMAGLILLWREWVGAQRGPLNPAPAIVSDEGRGVTDGMFPGPTKENSPAQP